MDQLELPLIERQENNIVIAQRAHDGYINATAMCKAAGKEFKHYHSLQSTKLFLEELGRSVGIPTDLLVQTIATGRNELRGTWVHPQVAINLGQWASPKFAVLVSKWVIEWMTGGGQKQATLPWHVRRYLMNREKIPPTHFSMLDQMTLKLLAPLESRDYLLPDKMMPDISLGKMFCSWLRENGYDPDSFPTYTHVFGDGKRQPVQAKLYPNELMTDFNLELNNWIINKDKALKYFKDRDINSVKPLENMILSLPATETQHLRFSPT